MTPSFKPKLSELYRAFVAERPYQPGSWANRENVRAISRLAARSITTAAELIDSLPTLPSKLMLFGIWWLGQTKPPGTERVLLRLLHDDPTVRLTCAHTLGMLEGRRTIREFIRIGTTQLSSSIPDTKWLEAVIPGLKWTDDSAAVDILVTIYERTDLPGWLRGDAGDALGCTSQLHDRRTRIFQRVWAAAQRGIHEPDIEVVFWSMYVIMQLATNCYSDGNRRSNRRFDTVLPRLREIAATDQRLAPGFWWPMSGEAQDAIEVIETGTGPQIDAGHRWQGNKERGPCIDRGGA